MIIYTATNQVESETWEGFWMAFIFAFSAFI